MQHAVRAILPLLLLALSLPAAASAAPRQRVETLSLQQALELAQAQNPEVLLGRVRQARAEAARLQAQRGVLPTVTADATYLHADLGLLEAPLPEVPGTLPLASGVSLDPFEGTILGVQLVQPLVNVGAWHAREQAQLQLEAARTGLGRISAEVAVTTIEAYFAAVTAGAQAEAEAGALAAARRALAQAEAAHREGLVSRLDVLNARTRVAEMEARLGSAEAHVIAAASALQETLGIDDDVSIELTDPVPDPPLRLAADEERLLQRADVRALQQAVAAAEAGVKRAQAGHLPDVNLFARYQRVDLNNPLDYDETDWIVGVTLGWTLFSGFGVAGAVDEAQADAWRRRVELSARQRRVQSEASDTRAWWQAELQAWQSAARSITDAEEAQALAERRYAEGLNDMTEVLQAQASALGARTRALQARYKAVVAAQRYLLAIGAQDAGRLAP